MTTGGVVDLRYVGGPLSVIGYSRIHIDKEILEGMGVNDLEKGGPGDLNCRSVGNSLE
jgi:hypothetical protein